MSIGAATAYIGSVLNVYSATKKEVVASEKPPSVSAVVKSKDSADSADSGIGPYTARLADVLEFFNCNRLTANAKSLLVTKAPFLNKLFGIEEVEQDPFLNLKQIYEKVDSHWFKNRYLPETVEQIKDIVRQTTVFVCDTLAAEESTEQFTLNQTKIQDMRVLSDTIGDELAANPVPNFDVLDNKIVPMLMIGATLIGSSMLAAPWLIPFALMSLALVIKAATYVAAKKVELRIEEKKNIKEEFLDPMIRTLQRRIDNMSGTPSNVSNSLNNIQNQATNISNQATKAAQELVEVKKQLEATNKKLEESEERNKQIAESVAQTNALLQQLVAQQKGPKDLV